MTVTSVTDQDALARVELDLLLVDPDPPTGTVRDDHAAILEAKRLRDDVVDVRGAGDLGRTISAQPGDRKDRRLAETRHRTGEVHVCEVPDARLRRAVHVRRDPVRVRDRV